MLWWQKTFLHVLITLVSESTERGCGCLCKRCFLGLLACTVCFIQLISLGKSEGQDVLQVRHWGGAQR